MPLMTIEFEHLFICLLAIYVNKSLTFMEPLKNARRPPPSGLKDLSPGQGEGQVSETEEGLLSLKGFPSPRFKEQACMVVK